MWILDPNKVFLRDVSPSTPRPQLFSIELDGSRSVPLDRGLRHQGADSARFLEQASRLKKEFPPRSLDQLGHHGLCRGLAIDAHPMMVD